MFLWHAVDGSDTIHPLSILEHELQLAGAKSGCSEFLLTNFPLGINKVIPLLILPALYQGSTGASSQRVKSVMFICGKTLT